MPLRINPVTCKLDLVMDPGGGTSIISVEVDSNTAPGTDPVLGTAGGQITIGGAAVAAHSVPIETHSRAANEFNIEVQVGAAVTGAPGTTASVGMAQFDDTSFSVDSDGYVTLVGGGPVIDTLTGDDLVPVSPDGSGNINIFTSAGLATTGVGSTLTVSPDDDLLALENLASTGLAARTGANTWAQRTITGTTDFIAVTNGDGVAGNPTIDVDTPFETTGMHGWNGSILETTDVNVTSDGATITLDVAKAGGGNLTVVFSDGYDDWVTAPDTVTLTAGTDTSPQINYIYFLQSTKTLTNNTSDFPTAEHAPIATVICQSAASLVTQEAYKVHVWTDHLVATTEQGHVTDINHWIRHQNATWNNGVLQTYTITVNGGSADNVILTTASGSVLQLHDHVFPAFSGTPDIYVINDNATPYNIVTDLNALLTDSTGASMSGKFFSLIIWGVVSEDESACKLFCNLPGGSYNNATSLSNDPDRFANFSIPSDFKGTGFLISQWNLRHQVANSGTWTSIEEIDLRPFVPFSAVGGTNPFPSEFIDNVFRILDDGDNTKEIAFQASGITTATTRTMTVPDADGTIAYASGLAANGFAYALDGNTLDSTAAATNGQLLIGSTGLVPVAATLNPGVGVSITNGAGSITISSSGGGFTWNDVAGTSDTFVASNGYITNNAGLVTITLPATCAVGDSFRIGGLGAGGWKIAQNASQLIHIGNMDTTTGAGGSLASTDRYDTLELLCVVTNNEYLVLSQMGNITVV